MLSDVRYAFRTFRRAPGFYSLVVAILGLGIAFSVSIFSLVDGILVRPLPYSDPQRLVMLTSYATHPPFASNGSLSWNDFLQFRAAARSFADVACTFRTGWSRVTLNSGSEPVAVQGAFVSPNLFRMFGRHPLIGRTFTDTGESGRRSRGRHQRRIVGPAVRLIAAGHRTGPCIEAPALASHRRDAVGLPGPVP